MTGILEEGGKVATTTVEALKSTPLAIALLAVNVAFLAFSGFVLKAVAENSSERNKSQMELIAKLVTDCRPGTGPRGEMDHLLPPGG